MPHRSPSTRPDLPPSAPAERWPDGWRQAVWLALLVAGSVAFSLGFACVTPFAAFAAAAAMTLPKRQALALIAAVWLANQLVGFTAHDYPWMADTLAWGAMLGIAAGLSTLAARAVAIRLAAAGALVRLPAVFAAAFALYQGTLIAAALTPLGGISAFTPIILAQVALVNAAALIGLLVLHRAAMAIGLTRPVALAARRSAIA